MATLTNGISTTSPGKKSGVQIKGVHNINYGQNGSVTIKKGKDYLEPVIVTSQTDITRVTDGKKDMSITNNTGATIEYYWIN